MNLTNITSFFVFSDDWGQHPSSCQHLFREISKRHRVVWVNTIGMRDPRLNWVDFRKAWGKIRKMVFTSPSVVSECTQTRNISVCQPAMLPFAQIGWVRWVNRQSVLRSVNRLQRSIGMQNPVLVTTVPNACDYVGFLGEKKVVYYCVDDFSEWPGVKKQLVRSMDEKLIAKSDILVATSLNLFKKLKKTGKPTYMLPHGVDITFFSQLSTFEHDCLSEIPTPRVGYIGLFDERSDQTLIAKVVERMPDCSFVFTGPVATDISKLSCYKNVFFTGKVPYSALPSVIKGLEALFIPYVKSKLTNSISPLKLKEYLASGKPVVSTCIPGVTQFKEWIDLPATIDDWVSCLRININGARKVRGKSLELLLANDSWESKAKIFIELCL
jgi:glycosyltransferase involved in cell wall biosynthesis